MNFIVGNELREYLDLHLHFADVKTEAQGSDIISPNNKHNSSQFQSQALFPHHI